MTGSTGRRVGRKDWEGKAAKGSLSCISVIIKQVALKGTNTALCRNLGARLKPDHGDMERRETWGTYPPLPPVTGLRKSPGCPTCTEQALVARESCQAKKPKCWL